MSFQPIAIVGQACVLPGALTPQQLWEGVLANADLTSACPEGRWRLPKDRVLGRPGEPERAFTDRGGYVSGFEQVFDPAGFQMPADQIRALDPLVHWVLHTAREALGDKGTGKRVGAVLGNLSLPSEGLAAWAETHWLAQQGTDFAGGDAAKRAGVPALDPRDRFMSGLPARLLARALGLSAGAIALDAACASSLYAIKLACDRLADGDADVMLAGAVNRADDLFLHVGFSTLKALSPTGQSRPFHQEADGLLPAEGAAFVALKRLADALADGDEILGVVRGVGLSNDGRASGMLVPDRDGQARAIRAAYEVSGVDPASISLIECHATGTVIGDATELASLGRVLGADREVPLGSIKGNLGHPITVAGLAGVLKLLAAMRAGLRPPGAQQDEDASLEALAVSPFRLLTKAEPWPAEPGDRPRRAAISAFGFGGNNAHLVLEEWRGTPPAAAPTPKPAGAVALVGLGARVGDGRDAQDFARALFAGGPGAGRAAADLALPLAGLRFPPNDLAATQPQQLAILVAAREALAGVAPLPRERTAVLVGMGCDAAIARYGMRWRLGDWATRWAPGAPDTAAWVASARDATNIELSAAGVVGSLPNIVANRLNAQFDLAGPSFAVSAEEGSGVAALGLALRALRAGEIDAALVGAVDLAHEGAHAAAAARVLAPHLHDPADGAVAFVLKRLDDALAAGDPVLAVFPDAPAAAPTTLALGPGSAGLTPRLGHAHAASGLIHVAAAALAVRHGALPDAPGKPARPWDATERAMAVEVVDCGGGRERLQVAAAPGAAPAPVPLAGPRVHLFAAADRAALVALLGSEVDGLAPAAGPQRVAIVAHDAAELAARRERAARWLEGLADRDPAGLPGPGDGIVYRAAPLAGELAFVFTGSAAAYAGMGAELRLAFNDLVGTGRTRWAETAAAARWIHEDTARPTPLERLWGASALCQLHAAVSLDVLALRPAAVLGLSSGESNALAALGAWPDFDGLFRDFTASGAFQHELGGDYAVLGERAAEGWATWRVAAPLAALRQALAAEPRVRLTIVMGPEDAVIAGPPEDCRRVLAGLDAEAAMPLGYDVVVHAPELQPFAERWRELHRRETKPVPGVRFYTHATGAAYEPTADAAANALLAQALAPIDFPALVERAYADGVRVFVEHGPQGGLASAVRRVLGDRPHLAVSLDLASESSLDQLATAAAALAAAGVPVALDRLNDRLAGPMPAPLGPAVTYPAHPPAVHLPPLPGAPGRSPGTAPPAPAPSVPRSAPLSETAPLTAQPMLPAPKLPPVLGTGALTQAPAFLAGPTPDKAWTGPGTGEITLPADPALAAVWAAQQGYLSLVAQQAAVHQAFLAQSQAAFLRLMASLQGQPMAATVPVLPAPVVPPAPVAKLVPAAPPAQEKPTAPNGSAPVASPPATPPLSLRERDAGGPVQGPKPGEGDRHAAGALTHQDRLDGGPGSLSQGERGGFGPAPIPTGPAFDRHQLETLASGRISEVFGPLFERQDGYHRQVRMPEPPLLLADRVTGIKGEPGSMRLGTIWTETDVRHDSWYLYDGVMPAGVMIESGQADLLLISWLGADFLNQSERVYRLLGCELTYHAHPTQGHVLPTPGETLKFDIHVDGHAKQGDVRLFFFHYDCRIDGHPRLTVRSGQAGFFTDGELAESGGVLWDAETQELVPQPRLAAPRTLPAASYTAEQVRAFADGRPADCFGATHAATRSHQRSPRIAGGKLCFLHDVTHLDPTGGPWGRGYMRAVSKVTPEDWFFGGHFKNDPCMPGTLMFEGTLQAMAFYLAALGFTLDRDGWRFEPVPEEKFLMRCRGQVIPSSREMVYEVFVEEVVEGDRPTLYADLLVTVDGLKAFHCRRMALQLVPGFPLESRPEWLDHHVEPRAVATTPTPDGDAFPFDYASLLACAWGRPSDAFGPAFERFDHGRRLPRLPGPPYHFMSRVTAIDGALGEPRTGSKVEVEFDIDPNAWYFRENGAPTMPYAVLLEAALQPCGWLASFIGTPLDHDFDLFFRNLDGTSTQFSEVTPEDGVLTTSVELKGVAKSGGIIIVKFAVSCRVGDRPVYQMDTVFGFFPEAALASQAGIPPTDEERAALEAPSDFMVDLTTQPEKYAGGHPRLPDGQLLMIDRVTGYWPTGGKAGLGRLRAEKDVDPGAWFFKAHFFQDPVQPGSLGLEAMLHALQFYMIERRLGEGLKSPRFEPIAIDRPMTWKYRGQVRPHNHVITTELEITEIGRDERGVFAVAEAYLWVDGMRIYQGVSVGMRLVEGATGDAPEGPADEVLDPALDTWLADHQPTYVLPVLPFMSIVDRLAGAAVRERPGQVVTALDDVHVKRWVALSGGPLRLKTEVAEVDGQADALDVTLLAWRDAANAELSRFEPVATGRVRLAARHAAPPAPLAPPADAKPVPSPYETGQMFHGPAFQVLTSLAVGEAAATATLKAAGGAPTGTLNQVLLDGVTHAFPGDDLGRWSSEVPEGMVGYPSRLTSLAVYGPTPTQGEVRCEVRFDGFAAGAHHTVRDAAQPPLHGGHPARMAERDVRHPAFRFQLIAGDRVWAEGRLVYILFPKGKLGSADPTARRAFLAERKAIAGMGLATVDGERTRLAIADVRNSDWLPGTLARLYGATGEPDALARQIAVKEHLARKLGEHPGAIRLTPDGLAGAGRTEPLTVQPVVVDATSEAVTVSDGGAQRLDVTPVRDYWRRKLGQAEWPVEDLYFGLIERFVGKVVVADPDAFARVAGRSVLYLANHQTGVESLLFSVIAAGLTGVPTAILAKAEHQTSWLGELIYHNFAYPGVLDPRLIKFFDRQDPASLPKIVAGLKQEMVGEGKSLMVHAAGTRALAARTPVGQVSAAFIDLALEAGLPIVPVRFVGGLPVEPLAERVEFPVGFGRQDYHFGAPLWPEELQALPLPARKQTVLEALDHLGPALASEEPGAPDPAFAAEVAGFRARTGLAEVPAVIYKTLEHLDAPCDAVRELVAAVRQGREIEVVDTRSNWLAMMADWLAGRRERLLGGRNG